MIGSQTLCGELFVRVEWLWGIPSEYPLEDTTTSNMFLYNENGTCINLPVKGLGTVGRMIHAGAENIGLVTFRRCTREM